MGLQSSLRIASQQDELTEYGNNEALLQQICRYTGGRFNLAPSQVFDCAGRAMPRSLNLWPGLLGLAVLLNIAELINRKWKGILEFLQSRRAVTA